MRGSRDFDDLAAYRRFVDEIVSRMNARNRKRIDVERSELKELPEEVIRDEHPVESAPRSVPDLHRTSEPGHDNTPGTLAQLVGGNAKADRTEPCSPTDADATNTRAARGARAC